jgi:hypothetical protein
VDATGDALTTESGSRFRDGGIVGIGIHEIEIESHCVDLVVKLAGEGNNFRDECLAPDRELGQVYVLVPDFRKVIIETDSFGIAAHTNPKMKTMSGTASMATVEITVIHPGFSNPTVR